MNEKAKKLLDERTRKRQKAKRAIEAKKRSLSKTASKLDDVMGLEPVPETKDEKPSPPMSRRALIHQEQEDKIEEIVRRKAAKP